MKDEGGPAFPLPQANLSHGMSMRDYFAARAMHGQLGHTSNVMEYGLIAKNAYGIADAMLKERDK